MTRLRCNPFREFEMNTRNFDSLINDYMSKNYDSTISSAPTTDVWENENSYVMDLEFPGYDRKEIKVIAEDKSLVISAEKDLNEKDERRYIKKERNKRNLKRTFRFKDSVDFENVQADYKNGLLTITIPKIVNEVEKERIIKVK